MPKLILSMDGLVLKEIVLSKERTSIGRKPVNDIQIDNLSISGQHALITHILGDTFLEDLNSTNGTYVNGQPVKKHVLRNNDVIELGKYRIKYLIDSSTPGVSATELIDSSALKPFEVGTVDPAQPLPTPNPETTTSSTFERTGGTLPPTRLGVIQVLTGVNVGQELELTKPVTTLGQPGQQIAVITRREVGYYLAHVEGNVRTTVNGEPVGERALKLREHDIMEIAGVKMEFYLRS